MKLEDLDQNQTDGEKRQLLTAHDTLKKSYPEITWPELEETSSDDSFLQVYFSEVERAFDASGLEEEQRFFATDTGYMGSAKACEGDEIILIKRGHVPYVFRRVDDALRHRVRQIDLDKEFYGKYKNQTSKLSKTCRFRWRREMAGS